MYRHYRPLSAYLPITTDTPPPRQLLIVALTLALLTLTSKSNFHRFCVNNTPFTYSLISPSYMAAENKYSKQKLYKRYKNAKKGKGSPYWNTERRVLEVIPVLGSQPAGDVSHKPGGRLPLFREAYWKERSVIRREDDVDGRASVTKDEERVLRGG